MGPWSYYFLAKLGLHATGLIGFHWLPNLVLALLLGAGFREARWWQQWRHWFAAPAAFALFWYDSHWPAFARVVQERETLLQFVPSYWVEMLSRSVSWRVLGGLLLGALLWYGLNKRLRLGTLAVVGILCVPLATWWPSSPVSPSVKASEVTSTSASNPRGRASENTQALARPVPGPVLESAALTQRLQRFYDQQQGISVTLDLAGSSAKPAFDLVFLSVCSLSWDDLVTVGLGTTPLLGRFDLLFKHFNSAASYSGPAVLRLLQATCGQPAQSALYQPAPAHCYLFEQLERLGYTTEVRLNHQGQLANFAKQLRDHGRASRLSVPDEGMSKAMTGIDGTPIRADLDVLKQWISERSTAGRPRALLYNTITLHDGNEIPGIGAQVSKDSYRKVADKFMSDLQEFVRLVEASGRPTVLVLVPEHGAAINGDARQIAGLREFPTPRITEVPAGVALLGFGVEHSKNGPVVVEHVVSYSTLIGAVSVLLNKQPVNAQQALRDFASKLGVMDWVAENDSTVVIRAQERAYMRTGSADWAEYPSNVRGGN